MAKKKKKKSTSKKPAAAQKNTSPAKKESAVNPAFIIGVIIAVVLIAGAVTVAVFVNNNNSGNSAQSSVITEIDENKTYIAEIDIKDYGLITVELDQKAAPVTVKNFVKLANSGFYDGLTFHRIIKDFMMQGGDPKGNGQGGSGETIVGEFSVNGHENPISHVRGTISMARSGMDYNSASSQFFIVHKDYPSIDGKYAAFGKVTSGIEVVDKVCETAKPIDNNGTIPTEQQPVINSIKITAKEK